MISLTPSPVKLRNKTPLMYSVRGLNGHGHKCSDCAAHILRIIMIQVWWSSQAINASGP